VDQHRLLFPSAAAAVATGRKEEDGHNDDDGDEPGSHDAHSWVNEYDKRAALPKITTARPQVASDTVPHAVASVGDLQKEAHSLGHVLSNICAQH
jgi:hypothetical protein